VAQYSVHTEDLNLQVLLAEVPSWLRALVAARLLGGLCDLRRNTMGR
jgi:hypothetical protein